MECSVRVKNLSFNSLEKLVSRMCVFQNGISSVVVISLLNIVLKLCVLEIDGPVSLKHMQTATFLGHDAAFLNLLF